MEVSSAETLHRGRGAPWGWRRRSFGENNLKENSPLKPPSPRPLFKMQLSPFFKTLSLTDNVPKFYRDIVKPQKRVFLIKSSYFKHSVCVERNKYGVYRQNANDALICKLRIETFISFIEVSNKFSIECFFSAIRPNFG